jgi:hypothetical protein
VTHYETDHLEDVKLVQNLKNLVYLNCQHLFASNGANQSGKMIEVLVDVSDGEKDRLQSHMIVRHSTSCSLCDTWP